ncbi:MAG: hypothetical protein AAF547_09880 [Actinomycetota bacterium]
MSATSQATTAGDRGPMAARIAWSVVSQGLSSVTNFGLTAVLAVSVTTETLGRVAAVYSIYLLALTLSRALTTDALVAATDGLHRIDLSWHWARRRIVALAAAASAVAVAVGLVVEVPAGVLAAVAAATPALLLQDGMRNLAWANGRPAAATALDGIWLAVSLLGLAVAMSGSTGLTATPIVLVWAAGGVASWLVGRPLIERPLRAELPTEFRPELARFRPLAYSQAVMALAVNLGPVVVALALGPTMAGIVKAALLPITPVLSLFAGLRVVTLPALRRAVDQGTAAGATSMLVAGSSLVAAIGGFVSIQVVRSLPVDQVGQSIAQVAPHLAWIGLLGIMYVASQQLADATAIAGRHAVLGRRVFGVITEWGCLMVGASLGGIEGLVIGWVIGLGLATMAWLQPALQP